MKIRNLFQLLISTYILIFTYEVSACSCFCISDTDYDSILDIYSTGNGSQPDSILSSFVSMHKRMFFGTIESVEATGDGTETVKVTIDTVIKGQINSNSLTLINIPYKGDCVSSAEFIKGLSFLGYIDSVNLPVHLHELGFYTVSCGSGLRGYLYRSGSLVRLSSVTIDTSYDLTIMDKCTTAVFLFDSDKLFGTPVKEKVKFRNSYNIIESADQYYSITGKKLHKIRTNSVIIVASNKRKNPFSKVLNLEN